LPTRPGKQIICVVAEPYGSFRKHKQSLHSFALTKPFGGRFLWQQLNCFYQNNTYTLLELFSEEKVSPTAFKCFKWMVKKHRLVGRLSTLLCHFSATPLRQVI
jgi:hypothetical protein